MLHKIVTTLCLCAFMASTVSAQVTWVDDPQNEGWKVSKKPAEGYHLRLVHMGEGNPPMRQYKKAGEKNAKWKTLPAPKTQSSQGVHHNTFSSSSTASFDKSFNSMVGAAVKGATPGKKVTLYSEGSDSSNLHIDAIVISSLFNVSIQPLDDAVTLDVLAESHRMTRELIAAMRARGRNEGELKALRRSPQVVIYNTNTAVATSYGGTSRQCTTQPKQQCTKRICVRCWGTCGSYFIATDGKRWNRSSGPSQKGLRSLSGTHSGNTFTSGGTTYTRG